MTESRRIVTVSDEEGLAPFADAPLYAGFDTALIARQRADAHLVAAEGERPVARCSLWWNDPPPLPGEKVGVIGHFAASGSEPAAAMLHAACALLADRDSTLAVGPMDGTTWNRYRFVTHRGDEPAFFMEPDNPDDYPAQWLRAGFGPLATYRSALEGDLALTDPRLGRVEERLAASGVAIRQVRLDGLDAELRRIYDVTIASFTNAFMYTPVSFEEFAAQYRAVTPVLRAELVLLAEHEDRPVGYAFALPDMAQAARGEPVDTVVIKTVAVLPGREFAGLGLAPSTRSCTTPTGPSTSPGTTPGA
jgi:hypothetical protein